MPFTMSGLVHVFTDGILHVKFPKTYSLAATRQKRQYTLKVRMFYKNSDKWSIAYYHMCIEHQVFRLPCSSLPR